MKIFQFAALRSIMQRYAAGATLVTSFSEENAQEQNALRFSLPQNFSIIWRNNPITHDANSQGLPHLPLPP